MDDPWEPMPTTPEMPRWWLVMFAVLAVLGAAAGALVVLLVL